MGHILARHERGRLRHRSALSDAMTRYPAIVLALVWSCALAASVVLVPGRPLIGVIAIASSVPLMGLALILRPALLALAIAAALLAVGRAEWPAGDPNMPTRAAALAGSTVALNGRVADDARSVGGGAEVRIEPATVAPGARPITALSGLKVAVFARIVQGALTPVLGRLATWPALGLIALYALAGGATPAAVRASAMGGLAIAATHLGRPSHVWTSLAITAAAMLGWHPELAWDVGFQLSFAGTAAIILMTPAIARRLGFLPHVVR